MLAPYIRDFVCIHCGQHVQPFYGEKNTWTHTDIAYAASGKCRDPQADSKDINERLHALKARIVELERLAMDLGEMPLEEIRERANDYREGVR